MSEQPFHGKSIILGVSGSIAAYRAADVAGKLTQQGALVHVAMTEHARQFIGPATFRALTGRPVLTGVFDEPYDGEMAHISIAQSADLILLAPATANLIAKVAHGIADDALTTLILAATAPIMVAPAMNTVMLENPATQANLKVLLARGIEIIEPGIGRLACGSEGKGRLADIETILSAVSRKLGAMLPRSSTEARVRPAGDLSGLRIVVSAGATREPLDPVRFISNRSSGKMGGAIAEAALRRGAAVTLLAGHMTVDPPAGVELVRFSTTADYLGVAQAAFAEGDVFIGAAAPADYAPSTVADRKLKKADIGDTCSLDLSATPDVIASLAAVKGQRTVVGFAAETQDVVASAGQKLSDKGLDLIVANDVSASNSGFDSDSNAATLVWPTGKREDLPLMPKAEMADRILDAVRDLRHPKP